MDGPHHPSLDIPILHGPHHPSHPSMGLTNLPWTSPSSMGLTTLPWTSPSSKGHTTLPTRPCASQPFHAPLHSSKQPLSTPAWPSLPLPGPTQSPPFHCPCLHLYPGPVALLPRLLWPCCLISTSTMALLPYYHVYCGPIALLPPLLWSCCLVYFQHPFSIKKLLFYPQLLVCKKILLIYT